MKRGPVTGRQADRCKRCDHMRRFHKRHVTVSDDIYECCSACGSPDLYLHAFIEKEQVMVERG